MVDDGGKWLMTFYVVPDHRAHMGRVLGDREASIEDAITQPLVSIVADQGGQAPSPVRGANSSQQAS